jgi:hypothetical protein
MPVLVAAVLTMSAAQLLDLATFWTMVHRLGSAAEANPLVGLLFGLYGYPLVAIAKVVLLALVTAIGAILLRGQGGTRGHARLVAAVLVAGTVIGLVGGISNTIAIGALPLV